MARTAKANTKSTPPPPPPYRQASVFADPPRKNVFLLSCMDQRLLDDIVKFMNSLNLHNRYDQLALAGGAMGALKLPDPNLPVEERWSTVFFIHLEKAINALHRPIKDVFLLDHLDCGAYKSLHPDEDVQKEYAHADKPRMTELHRQELSAFAGAVNTFIHYQLKKATDEFNAARKACEKCDEHNKGDKEKKCWEQVKDQAKEKVEAWSDIRISYFVMDLLGVVTQLDLPDDGPPTLKQQS